MSKDDVQDFVEIDQNVLSSSAMTDAEIIEEIQSTSASRKSDDEEDDQSTTPAIEVPTYAQVIWMLSQSFVGNSL